MYDFLSDAMVWIKDDKLKYRCANHAFLLNFSLANRSQVIGQIDHDFTAAYLADLYRADDMRVLAGKTIVARVEPVGTLEAIPQWNQTWKQPLRNRNGKIIGALGLTRPLPDTDTPEFPYPELVPLNHMRTYCTGSITNTELADLAELSVRAFERKFKRHMQMIPNQFLMGCVSCEQPQIYAIRSIRFRTLPIVKDLVTKATSPVSSVSTLAPHRWSIESVTHARDR